MNIINDEGVNLLASAIVEQAALDMATSVKNHNELGAPLTSNCLIEAPATIRKFFKSDYFSQLAGELDPVYLLDGIIDNIFDPLIKCLEDCIDANNDEMSIKISLKNNGQKKGYRTVKIPAILYDDFRAMFYAEIQEIMNLKNREKEKNRK